MLLILVLGWVHDIVMITHLWVLVGIRIRLRTQDAQVAARHPEALLARLQRTARHGVGQSKGAAHAEP